MQEQLFTLALGLTPPWAVDSVSFRPDEGAIHFEVAVHDRLDGGEHFGVRKRVLFDHGGSAIGAVKFKKHGRRNAFHRPARLVGWAKHSVPTRK